MVFPTAKQPLIIQVTERLNSDNLSREIKGLEMARKRIPNSKGLLLVEMLDQTIDSFIQKIDTNEIQSDGG